MIKMSMLSDSAFVMTKNNDPVNTELMSLAHFAFCGQVALHLADQDSGPLSPMGQHLFVLRWLVTAQKQKRFPKVVASEIAWLIDRGRRLGAKANLASRLEYLYRSCHEPVAEQSDLFRLTYVIESLKVTGWRNYLLSAAEWSASAPPVDVGTGLVLMMEKQSLHASFDEDGTQIMPVEMRVLGPIAEVVQLLDEQRYHCYKEAGGTGWQRLFISTTPIAEDFSLR
ncbi:DUF2913 family protein [Serratia fonticola]|uniref:DUF2913 family protein n=1 Tax=Serratia fonticola TaxID=47917 RepID=UPI0009BDA2B7|nr:DUF2913 family protein [Serratia fonticola]QCR62998.1 DUF2913 family protein [Serratia fonticola]